MFVTLTVGVAFAGTLPASASCECDLAVESTELAIYSHETCGHMDTTYTTVDWRNLTDRQIHALMFGTRLAKQLREDSGLRDLARRFRLTFGWTHVWSDTLGPGDWDAPRALSATTMDSLLRVFRRIDRDGEAVLHTVRLGAFRQRRNAEALTRRLDDLRMPLDGEEDADLRDTTRTVDWWHSTCVNTARPELFIAPPDSSGFWTVDYGLFIDAGDAQRAAERLRREHRVQPFVRALPFDPEVVRAAIRQWSVRGMVNSE